MQSAASPALVVIFNHRYEDNLPILEKMYRARFADVVYLMPFLTRPIEHTVAVYGSSFLFQGYIAQALERLSAIKCSHYVFVSDDLVLHPEFDGPRLLKRLGVSEAGGFIGSVRQFHDSGGGYWEWTMNGICAPKYAFGVRWRELLPAYAEAERRIRAHGVDLGDLVVRAETIRNWKAEAERRGNLMRNTYCVEEVDALLDYPMVHGYSDMFVVPKAKLREFGIHCAVFAAMGVFAEIGLPTALLLACDEVAHERPGVSGVTVWGADEVEAMGERHHYRISSLFEEHAQALYVHPVKLTRWKWDFDEA